MKFTCPQCGSENLRSTSSDQQSSEENFTVMYTCEDCKSEYKHFCGVPYFGGFYEEDLFSVMEVTSFLQSVHINENGMPTRKSGDGNQYESFRKVRNLLPIVCQKNKILCGLLPINLDP